MLSPEEDKILEQWQFSVMDTNLRFRADVMTKLAVARIIDLIFDVAIVIIVLKFR